jgi:hypothetical protein
MKNLAERDPVQYLAIASAVAPVEVREVMRDAMAEMGMKREDLQDMVDKANKRDIH